MFKCYVTFIFFVVKGEFVLEDETRILLGLGLFNFSLCCYMLKEFYSIKMTVENLK